MVHAVTLSGELVALIIIYMSSHLMTCFSDPVCQTGCTRTHHWMSPVCVEILCMWAVCVGLGPVEITTEIILYLFKCINFLPIVYMLLLVDVSSVEVYVCLYLHVCRYVAVPGRKRTLVRDGRN